MPRLLTFSTKVAEPAWAAMAAAFRVQLADSSLINIKFDNTLEHGVVLHADDLGMMLTDSKPILRYLGAQFPQLKLCGADVAAAAQIHAWLDRMHADFMAPGVAKTGPAVAAKLDALNTHFMLRSYVVGYDVSLADYLAWGALKGNPMFMQQVKSGKGGAARQDLIRWFQYMTLLPAMQQASQAYLDARSATKVKAKDQGSFDINLQDAEMGKVVTRFPPEPSGYLHIGHAKAALMNDYFARQYQGKLIVRFDDTNPSKEKSEFEESIKEDLAMLNIRADEITHTSSHFETLYQYALQIIKDGNAYVDMTPMEQMREERGAGIASKYRDATVEENLALFEEMKQGTETGLKCALRAKIDMQALNKALRDPVIYRCNLTPHHVTGTTWKMYPTYDFAVPIVDALEGVTHALRTVEYRDRNPQYQWFLDTLKLRQVHIWDYSRLNFVYTLLSKRKLTWFVENGHVTGWDDARFPTVRGVLRRGMTVEALRQYILMQGASQREMLLEWDKIWSLNKKIIDPVAPRHTALASQHLVPVTLTAPVPFAIQSIPKHKKNPDVGSKLLVLSDQLAVEQADATAFDIDEEVTFMDWGNAYIRSVERDAQGLVTAITAELHLDGDFKKTKKKVTWLSTKRADDVTHEIVPVKLIDYDYLITKKKLEEEDAFEDFVTPQTFFETLAVADCNVRTLKKGDIIQFERKGYYIVDRAYDAAFPQTPVECILIPDGRQASLESKAVAAAAKASPAQASPSPKSTATDGAAVKPGSRGDIAGSRMYVVPPVYAEVEPRTASQVSKMYDMPTLFHADAQTATKLLAEAAASATTEAPAAAAAPAKEKKAKKTKPAPVVADPISKLDIVVGKIVDVRKHPDADSLYVEQIDCGEAEPREICSGLVKYMQPEQLLNKEVLVLRNLKPVAMRGIKSFGMVLCASNAAHDQIEFCTPPAGSIPGDLVRVDGFPREPDAQINKKLFEKVQPKFRVSDDLAATYDGQPWVTNRGAITVASLAGGSIS